MAKNTQKVDLHVHSPASADYIGDRDDREYFALLKECKRAEVAAIAITDHNTVNGHIAIERLSKEARLNYDLNSKRGGPTEFLDQLKEEMLLFEDVSLLRAVEVSVYPKIHLLLFFSEKTDLAAIDEFLRTDLELEEAVTKGSPDKFCPHSPTVLLDKATAKFGDECFCILPHVDSSNGAWNELSGNPRADLFRAPQVLAAQVLSPETKKHLTEKVLRAEEYKRQRPLRIIQASDYHGGAAGEIARQYSMLETDAKLSFNSLRQHLLQDGGIKLSSDFIDERYNRLIEGREVIAFEFRNGFSVVDDELESTLAKALCGCLNSRCAMLQFNILNSAKSPGDEAQNLVDLIKKRLRLRLDPVVEFGFKLSDLSHSPTRQRFVFQPKENTRLRMVDGTAFTVAQKHVVAAGARDIEQIVTQNLYTRFGKRRQRSLSQASNRLLMIANSFPALSIAYRIDQLLDRALLSKLKHSFETPEQSTALEKAVMGPEANGSADGDVYVLRRDQALKAGRLTDSYFRFTMPIFNKADPLEDETATVTVPADTIIAYPEGGLHFGEHSAPVYAPFPIVMIRPQDDDQTLTRKTLLGLCALLKSTFLLWYTVAIHETTDIFEFLLRNFGRLPLPSDSALLETLSIHAERIVLSEKNLLKEIAKGKWDSAAREKHIQRHNRDATNNMRLIDRDIFRALQFDNDDLREVYRALDELKLFDYDAGKDLDAFVSAVTQK